MSLPLYAFRAHDLASGLNGGVSDAVLPNETLRMTRPLIAFFLVTAALSTAAQTTPARYIVGTKTAGNVAAARMLQTDEAVRAHAVRAFDNVPAFAATLTADEAAALRRACAVRPPRPITLP